MADEALRALDILAGDQIKEYLDLLNKSDQDGLVAFGEESLSAEKRQQLAGISQAYVDSVDEHRKKAPSATQVFIVTLPYVSISLSTVSPLRSLLRSRNDSGPGALRS